MTATFVCWHDQKTRCREPHDDDAFIYYGRCRCADRYYPRMKHYRMIPLQQAAQPVTHKGMITAGHVALVVSIVALLLSGGALYYQRRSAQSAEDSAKTSRDSAASAQDSAKAAEDSARSAREILNIEKRREYDRTCPKLTGRLVPDSTSGGPTNAWLEVRLDASTPQPLLKMLLAVPTGAWFGRGGAPTSTSLMANDFGFPGEPGQVSPLRLGRPARWRVGRGDNAHGTVVATALCTREDGEVWEDVEVPITQDFENDEAAHG